MMENKFTPRAEEALRLAQEAAEDMGHGYVGSEHLLLGLLRVLGFWLVAFLYQRARRREVAILRSLGTPKGSALGQALLPMGLLGFVGVMAGFVAAYYYGLEKAREAVASLQTAQSLAVRVPLTKLIGLGAAVWCFLLLFEAILLTIPSFCSIVPLLQGGKTHGKKSKE